MHSSDELAPVPAMFWCCQRLPQQPRQLLNWKILHFQKSYGTIWKYMEPPPLRQSSRLESPWITTAKALGMRRTERRITARRQSCDQLGRLSSLTERLIKWTKLLAKLVIYIRSVTFPYIYIYIYNIYIYIYICVCACILSYLKKMYILYIHIRRPRQKKWGGRQGRRVPTPPPTPPPPTTTNHHQPPPTTTTTTTTTTCGRFALCLWLFSDLRDSLFKALWHLLPSLPCCLGLLLQQVCHYST